MNFMGINRKPLDMALVDVYDVSKATTKSQLGRHDSPLGWETSG